MVKSLQSDRLWRRSSKGTARVVYMSFVDLEKVYDNVNR